MTVRLHLLDEMGKTFGKLAEDEHRSAHLCLAQKTKNTLRIFSRSIRDRKVPTPGGLGPVLNVDRDDRRTVG
jgi:hypothetical protein